MINKHFGLQENKVHLFQQWQIHEAWPRLLLSSLILSETEVYDKPTTLYILKPYV